MKREMKGLAVLFLATLTPGCSDSEPSTGPDVSDPHRRLTHPDSVIVGLIEAYNRREIEPYADLLASDFRFQFLPEDAGDIPDGIWSAAQDSAATAALFQSSDVVRVTLDLRWFPPAPDTRRGVAVQRVQVIETDLNVDIDRGNFTLSVDNARQTFYFRKGRPPGEDPGRWYLFEWVDEGNAAGLFVSVATTWGRIKRFAVSESAAPSPSPAAP